MNDDDKSVDTNDVGHSHRVSALFHGVSEKLYLTGKGNPKAIHIMNTAEKFAVLLAALAHGLGHDGLSTSYHVQMGTPVAMFYNDRSPNENRSLAILFELLGTPPLNHTNMSHPSPVPGTPSGSSFSNSFSTSGGSTTPTSPTNSLVSRMDPKSYRIFRKSLVRNLLQSGMGHHATRVSSLRLFAFEHGAKPPPAAAAAAAAAASKGGKNSNSDLGAMSPQAAAFAAASAAKRSCDLLRASFGPSAPKDKRDKARALIQQTVLHAGLLCTCACRSKNPAMYKAWVTRQHREWWKQAKLEQAHNLNKTTPFVVAAANPDSEGPMPKDVAEIEMGLFEQVILPFLVPLFDVFPPTRFLAKPLADNHALIASERRRDLSAEYRRADRRLNFANTVTERLIGVSRAPRRTASTYRLDKENSTDQEKDSIVAMNTSLNAASSERMSKESNKGEMKDDESSASAENASNSSASTPPAPTTSSASGTSTSSSLAAAAALHPSSTNTPLLNTPTSSGSIEKKEKKSLLRSNSGNWLRGGTKTKSDEGSTNSDGGMSLTSSSSSSSSSHGASGGSVNHDAPSTTSTSSSSTTVHRKSNSAASHWAVGLRWAAERADKIAAERASSSATEESSAVVWPSMTELRTSSMAAAAAAKANQLAVQKARLHLEARAAAFAQTLLPYVKKGK
jgi:hypothetical protein